MSEWRVRHPSQTTSKKKMQIEAYLFWLFLLLLIQVGQKSFNDEIDLSLINVPSSPTLSPGSAKVNLKALLECTFASRLHILTRL